MDKLQREMNQLFDSAYTNRLESHVDFPAINIWVKPGEGHVVTAELPGINQDDLDLKISGDVLTLNGKREKNEQAEEVNYHRQERMAGNFSRSIRLSFPVDSEKVEATYEKGILKIWLPIAETEKPRKISVKAV
jgi:HSP20 family protein